MRMIDLWFVCLNVWLVAAWLKFGWLPLAMSAFLLCGMLYIYRKRRTQ